MGNSLQQLSEFLCATGIGDLPAAVRQQSRLVIADTLAVIAGGSAEPEVQALSADIATTPDSGASVLGTGRRADAASAAFLNATAGTFLELDEGSRFARGHPSIHVVPVGLAFSESQDCSGSDLLLAITLGYEVGARIGIGSKLRPSIHPHGTWGTVAAAVTVAKLAGASAPEMREVINVASPLGLANSDRTMLEGGTVRNSFAGFSAQTGLMVWKLVRSGFSGEHDGLRTVWENLLSDSWDSSALTHRLGEQWEITRNYFKRHACCRYNHAALDVLTDLRTRYNFTVESIRSVEVETYAAAARLNEPMPRNTLAGKFSLPFAVATTLVHGDAGLSSFTWDAIRNERISELSARVQVRENVDMTAMLPVRRPARVTVRLDSNERVEGYTETNRGDPEDPYNQEELSEKFFELTDRVWPPDVSIRFFDTILDLERLKNINDLTRPLDGVTNQTC